MEVLHNQRHDARIVPEALADALEFAGMAVIEQPAGQRS